VNKMKEMCPHDTIRGIWQTKGEASVETICARDFWKSQGADGLNYNPEVAFSFQFVMKPVITWDSRPQEVDSELQSGCYGNSGRQNWQAHQPWSAADAVKNAWTCCPWQWTEQDRHDQQFKCAAANDSSPKFISQAHFEYHNASFSPSSDSLVETDARISRQSGKRGNGHRWDPSGGHGDVPFVPALDPVCSTWADSGSAHSGSVWPTLEEIAAGSCTQQLKNSLGLKPLEPWPPRGASSSSSSHISGTGIVTKSNRNTIDRTYQISKQLTKILRHKAEEHHMGIRPDGFCPLDAVISHQYLQELDCRKKDVDEIVKNSKKQRFEIRTIDDRQMIRAVQGHSMKVIDDDQALQRLEPDSDDMPENCVHGTYLKYLDSICSEGLLAGGGQGHKSRNHVHFQSFAPWDGRRKPGMKSDCEIAIWVDVKRAIRDGVPFFKSTNGYILSPGDNGIIDTKYFTKIQNLKDWKVLPHSF
jgi:2'-phosphotransferase